MSSILIVGLIVGVMILLVAGIFIITGGGGLKSLTGSPAPKQAANLRALVQAQRAQNDPFKEGGQRQKTKENLALVAAEDPNLSRKKLSQSSQMTLEKMIKYAQWKITPLQFRAIQALVTIVVFVPARMHLETPLQLLAFFITPQLVKSVLKRAMDRRFNAFDSDYPVLLMSYVSLLKTGMSTIAGLEAAAKGLEPDSLVRSEVELLIERLRLGLTEEQAINSFAEDVAHPELELFVQSLLLSRKVGGTLSTTLERLAKQVRKRQQFRQQAKAAVGLEQGSIYAIAFIMSGLMVYLTYASPELVLPALKHPMGKKIFQGGLASIIFGFWWSKQITNIKI
jgi:tight adherence protein B